MPEKPNIVLILVLTGFVFAACGEKPRPNFILFSVDTLRADHLGCYGYDRDTSPVIDGFARQSLVFTDCIAPASWTLPSHFAMLSGQHPYDQGIVNENSVINEGVPMLAESLAGAGYETAAFVDSRDQGFLGGKRGFDRGFSLYRHAPFQEGGEYEYDMAATADQAVDWLKARKGDQPFFLFLHTKSVHAAKLSHEETNPLCYPYSKPEPYVSRFLSEEGKKIRWSDPELGAGIQYLHALNERLAQGTLAPADVPADEREALAALYDGGIYYTDEQFGRVLSEVDRLGLAKNTVVIVTADHGEAFLEHRLLLHVEVYRQLLHVPLLIRLPGREGGSRLDPPVTLSDIPPTVLELAGIDVPKAMSGRPLPLDRDEAPVLRPRFSFYGKEAQLEEKIYDGYSMVLGPWALVLHRFADHPEPRAELYDLKTDPEERTPLAEPRIRKDLMAQLKVRLARKGKAGEIEMDAETREHLRELGYLK